VTRDDNTHARARRVSQRSKHHHAHPSPHTHRASSRRRHRPRAHAPWFTSVRRAKRPRRDQSRGVVRARLHMKPHRPLCAYKNTPTSTYITHAYWACIHVYYGAHTPHRTLTPRTTDARGAASDRDAVSWTTMLAVSTTRVVAAFGGTQKRTTPMKKNTQKVR